MGGEKACSCLASSCCPTLSLAQRVNELHVCAHIESSQSRESFWEENFHFKINSWDEQFVVKNANWLLELLDKCLTRRWDPKYASYFQLDWLNRLCHFFLLILRAFLLIFILFLPQINGAQ